jgi:putative hydrolase of the HAD superfamily
MLKVILFDADGVLINGKGFAVHLEQDLGWSQEKVLPFFAGPFQDCLSGKSDLKEVIAPFLQEWGWQQGVDDFLKYWFTVEHSVDQPLIDYIQRMRKAGIRCFVATNQERQRASYMLEEMGFSQSFDGLYASAHLGHTKPAREFFDRLLETLPDTTPEEMLFWDDMPANVAAARQRGLHAEIYTTFAEFQNTMEQYLPKGAL